MINSAHLGLLEYLNLCTFFPGFFYLLDITNILFLNIVSLFLNILSPSVYKLFIGIRVRGFRLCEKPVMHHLLYFIICISLTSEYQL